ncbi:hypothetical protein [Rhizobium lentis]|uniref:hypothetical protein n=1 Tax=Rhizobium lentis TaxID=1138194 RepID=UPI001A92C0F3|nr:hypothetical protein [Rhizobium lentis]MBX4998484.1 hypothetical protein [Rhizobium lentis]MBX5017072.1 hypothetical protein [Rhizobium lentis]MBX5065943.1 hypothetical protein [Rhizobium lentis]MBX5078996.1 hypothetical protein [Rhizobium lentis]QSW95493.1 hypothetical protein J0663_09835 [Rhizobium lentis]
MRLMMVLLISLVAVPGLAPASAFAVDWTKPIDSGVQPLYPYKGLPGVKAQPDKKEEESFNCRTETVQVRRRYDEIFRSGGMPTLMYVCERDGFVTTGRKVPLRGHYQPVR